MTNRPLGHNLPQSLDKRIHKKPSNLRTKQTI
nr:MAG TPA: hypothetical protein [Caudoviricetes sp.]DAY22834.1 MAG TPA: hypothetical protein [Caudoviricetes sp.]